MDFRVLSAVGKYSDFYFNNQTFGIKITEFLGFIAKARL